MIERCAWRRIYLDLTRCAVASGLLCLALAASGQETIVSLWPRSTDACDAGGRPVEVKRCVAVDADALHELH